MTEHAAQEQWRANRVSTGPNAAGTGRAYEWHIVDGTRRLIARCYHEADAQRIVAGHQQSAALAIAEAKAELADDIESHLRPKPRSGQQVGLRAFNRREWLARYDALKAGR